jgi:hypothetical protein
VDLIPAVRRRARTRHCPREVPFDCNLAETGQATSRRPSAV